MKKNYIKKILSLFLAILMLSPISLGLDKEKKAQKEEIIYAKLNFEGNSDLLIGVSGFPKGFKGYDYGEFSEIVNLSTPEELIYKNARVEIDAKENFYYQGNLKTRELPWIVSTKWTLDGQPVSEEELLGSSGHLELLFDIKANPAIDAKYFDYFVVQSSFQFNVDQITNLIAPDGTVAAAGSMKMVNFMSLPGKGGRYTLEADVANYEPGMVQIAALPLNLALDLSEMSEYTEDLKTLEMAIAQLNGGTWEFLDGLYQIKEGAAAYGQGGDQLLGGSGQLKDGLFGLGEGSSQISDGLGDLNQGISAFEEGVLLLSGGIDEFSQGIKSLKDGSNTFTQGLLTYLQGVEELSAGLHQTSQGSKDLVEGVEALGEGLYQLVVAGKGEPGHVDNPAEDPQTLIDASARFLQAFELLSILDGIQISPEQAQILVDSIDFLSNRLIPLLLEIDEDKLDEISNKLGESLLDLRISIDELQTIRQNLLYPADYPLSAEEDSELVERVSEHYRQLMTAEADRLLNEINRLEYIEGGLGLQREILDLFKNNFALLKDSFLDFQSFLVDIQALLTDLDISVDKILGLGEDLKKLSQGYALFHQGLVEYVDGVEAVYLGVAGEGDQTLLYGAKALSDGLDQLDKGGEALVDGGRELGEGAKELNGGIRGLYEGVQQFVGAKGELEDGIKDLSEGAYFFYRNYLEFDRGLQTLALGFRDFDNGLGDYVHGFWPLRQGLADLYSGGLELGRGTSLLTEETKDIDKKMIEQISDTLGELSSTDKKFESFLSPKNKDISSVQFVLLYEGKSLPQEEEVNEEIQEKTFLDRFIDLFKNLR